MLPLRSWDSVEQDRRNECFFLFPLCCWVGYGTQWQCSLLAVRTWLLHGVEWVHCLRCSPSWLLCATGGVNRVDALCCRHLQLLQQPVGCVSVRPLPFGHVCGREREPLHELSVRHIL